MSGETSPRVLVFPFYPDNPWSALLYRSLRDTGYEVLRADDFDAFNSAVVRLDAGDVIHVQWTAAIADGRDADRGRERSARFLELLTEARARGVALVWTVHNVVAHDASSPALEVELARALAREADAIHILNPATASEAADRYALPEDSLRLIRHSGYQGAYPDSLDRDGARASFGLEPDEIAVLHFGKPRRYRGSDLLADAVTVAASQSSRIRLLAPGAERVADADVQRWFLAADLSVLPYRAVLNSGATMLSATFGVPVLLPDVPAMRALYGDEGWAHWFDPTASDGLAAALGRFRPEPAERVAARQFAESYPPRVMSDAFRDLVEAVRTSRLARPATR